MRETVFVLDFGGRHSQNVARKIRQLGIYSEIIPGSAPISRLEGAKAVILCGERGDTKAELLDLKIPVLDLGSGKLATLLGCRLTPGGEANVEITTNHDLFAGLSPFPAELSFRLDNLPTEVTPLAEEAGTPLACAQENFYVVGITPSNLDTAQADALLTNFLTKIAGCRQDWSSTAFIQEEIAKIQAEVGETQVICGLSGGVDSSVAATLVHQAIGDQLTCIFVDHGLLRKNEAEEVIETFSQRGIKLVAVDARDRFLAKLEGVEDPELKRKIIGEEFIRVFEEEARKLGQIRYLVQGTLYPDVIESGEGGAKIKSHHNVGGLPKDMELELLEPLRELFKDEVREVGLKLGLPGELVYRQPFPGPGLAVRIIGSITREKIAILQEADAIVREELAKTDPEREIWQCFAVLTNTRAVGVRSEGRSYDYVVAVRAVSSVDGMSADWVRVPYPTLDRISQRLLALEHVGRVVYDISAKPPGTIEWE